MMNGIVNVYKEKGFTSFDVVAKMRGIFHQKKVGHTGTLDPDAEGVLPVCIGNATKVCGLLTDKDKVYETVLLLGRTTDTQDISGAVIDEREVHVTEADVTSAVMSYVGEIMQIPPMYSALKVNGKKLCDLARAGEVVERKPRPVTIYDIEILEVNLPRVHMRVHCGRGTYIRTLCQDIGEKLGCGGCMESLIRTRVSVFESCHAWRLSEIEAMLADGQTDFIYPVESVFWEYPAVYAVPGAKKLVENGNRIPAALVEDENRQPQEVRLYDVEGNFIGVYEYLEKTDDYKPVKLFFDIG